MDRKSQPEERWTHPGNKFVIGTLHGTKIEITAQYNPKELARQTSATWNPHANTSAKQSKTGGNYRWLEYGTTEALSLTVELLFDGYEEGISIAPIVDKLESLTEPVDLRSRDGTKRRPQLCVAVWGKQQLRCVVMSVATKLTMFDVSGEPLRATCTVTLKQVDVVAMMNDDFTKRRDDLMKLSGRLELAPRERRLPYPPEDSKPTRVPPRAPVAKPAPAPTDQKAPPAQAQTIAPNTPAKAAAKPTAFEPGTSQTPAGTYQTGEASTPGDESANQIQGSDPAKPTAFEPGTSQTPAGNYQTGAASTPGDESANQIVGSAPKTTGTPSSPFTSNDVDDAGDRTLPASAPKNFKPPTDLE